jgi:hypothetical protein
MFNAQNAAECAAVYGLYYLCFWTRWVTDLVTGQQFLNRYVINVLKTENPTSVEGEKHGGWGDRGGGG